MTNIESLTYLAQRNGYTLNEFVLNYLIYDDFKKAVDICLKDINSRRVPNGLEKIQINFSVFESL